MSINFIKTLRQQDLKILNQNELKFIDKLIPRSHENELSLSNLSIKKLRKKNFSLDKIILNETKVKQKIEEPNYQNLFLKDKKKLVAKNISAGLKVLNGKLQINPGVTKNNFFLTSNRLNLQSRQDRNNLCHPDPQNNVLDEFLCFKKPLTANVGKRRKEGLTKGQNQLILEKLREKYNLNGKPNKKNSTSNNFFPSISGKFTELKEDKISEGYKTDKNFRIRNHKPDKDRYNIEDKKMEYSGERPEPNFDFINFRQHNIYSNINEDDIIIENEHFKDQTINIKEPSQKILADFTKIDISRDSNGETNIEIIKLEKKHVEEDLCLKNFIENDRNENNELQNYNNEKVDDKNKSEKQAEHKIKLEDVNVANVLKRVIENNKREASVRQRELYSSYPKSYLNLNKTQSNFFIGSNTNGRPTTEFSQKSFLNTLEFQFQAIPLWKKHEEIWNNVTSYGFIITPELEKYLLPPNEYDVLLSSYCKLTNEFYDKIIINDSLKNPNDELKKWKNAYKRAVMRWHPDKLFPLIDKLKLKDEGKKNILKKKASHIMNNMYKMMQTILEILRKIIKRKQTVSNK